MVSLKKLTVFCQAQKYPYNCQPVKIGQLVDTCTGKLFNRSAKKRDFTEFLIHKVFCVLNRSVLRNSKIK